MLLVNLYFSKPYFWESHLSDDHQLRRRPYSSDSVEQSISCWWDLRAPKGGNIGKSHHVFLVKRRPSPAVGFIAALASGIGNDNMRKGKNCKGREEPGRLDGRKAVEEGGGGKHQVDGGGGRPLCHGPWLPEDDQEHQGWQFPASTRQQKPARWRKHRVQNCWTQY